MRIYLLVFFFTSLQISAQTDSVTLSNTALVLQNKEKSEKVFVIKENAPCKVWTQNSSDPIKGKIGSYSDSSIVIKNQIILFTEIQRIKISVLTNKAVGGKLIAVGVLSGAAGAGIFLSHENTENPVTAILTMGFGLGLGAIGTAFTIAGGTILAFSERNFYATSWDFVMMDD